MNFGVKLKCVVGLVLCLAMCGCDELIEEIDFSDNPLDTNPEKCYNIWLFRVKCGNGASYRNAAMTRIRKCSKLRNPKARRLMSLILLLMPSTMPLVVR